MAEVHPDLDAAISKVLGTLSGQTEEFKRRLRRLLENSTEAMLRDAEVREVIDLAAVDEGTEE